MLDSVSRLGGGPLGKLTAVSSFVTSINKAFKLTFFILIPLLAGIVLAESPVYDPVENVYAQNQSFTAISGCEDSYEVLHPIHSAINAKLSTNRTNDLNRVWVVDSICAIDEWAYAYVKPYDPVTLAPVVSRSDVALGHLINESWSIALPEDFEVYQELLRLIPTELLSTSVKPVLTSATEDFEPLGATNFSGYFLPYPQGQGANTYDNHGYPAKDFGILGPGQIGIVRNSKAGTVKFVKDSSSRSCGDISCWQWANAIVLEVAPNEFSWYLHFAQYSIPDWIQQGVFIPAGTDLGKEGTTGWVTGPHVHFMVADNYDCCWGSGDSEIPHWPDGNPTSDGSTHRVDFFEYSWDWLPGWAISANGGTGACAPPVRISPSDGYVSNSPNITFDWQAVSGCQFDGYTFRIKTVNTMDYGGDTYIDTGTGSTSHQLNIDENRFSKEGNGINWHNRDLYWGVRPANCSPNCDSSWSIGRFRIESQAEVSINANPHTLTQGQSVNVTWSGLAPTGNDWISLHPASEPDSSYLTWKRISGASGSILFSNLTQRGEYNFRLFRNGIKVGTSNILFVQGPSNDSFDQAEVVSTLPFSVRETVRYAKSDEDDPPFAECNLGSGSATVWYHFTASESRPIYIDTFGSNYDTILGVWTGGRADLRSIACNDDSSGGVQSSITVNVTRGETYYIEVADYGNNPSPFLDLRVIDLNNRSFLPLIFR